MKSKKRTSQYPEILKEFKLIRKNLWVIIESRPWDKKEVIEVGDNSKSVSLLVSEGDSVTKKAYVLRYLVNEMIKKVVKK